MNRTALPGVFPLVNSATTETENDSSAHVVRSFGVLLDRKAQVEASLVALLKRALRRGIPGVLTWSWGKAYADVATVPNVDGHPPTCDATLSGAEFRPRGKE